LREAEVQQPKTAAQWSLISSFLDFSAKVGQSEAPSSLMTLILRPRMPPISLIWSMASCSAWIEPVSEIAMVPVDECSWPTVTSVSVTASLVVLTLAVGNCDWPKLRPDRPSTGKAAAPCSRRRRRNARASREGSESRDIRNSRRRDYNSWVAQESLEDYALRYTPQSFRKWSELRVANTAFGAASFLVLEAVGATLLVQYGFVNAFWAILATGLIIALAGWPIAVYAARHGVDMDLLTRGAGFGYLGSTITSLIYASFTFIFFALEAAVMAYALDLAFDIPPAWGYLVCAVVVLPLVTHGVTPSAGCRCGRSRCGSRCWCCPTCTCSARTRTRWPGLWAYAGEDGQGGVFDLLKFGSAMTVGIALMTQMGEQADYLRFMPARTAANRKRWWAGRGHRRPGLGAAGRAEDAGRRAAGVDRDRAVGAAGSRRRPEPDVPRGLGHRVQPARHGGGGDGGVRRAVAAEDQRHQRVRRLARVVELLRAAHAQPPGPRGVGRVQHGHRADADGAGRVHRARQGAGPVREPRDLVADGGGGRPRHQQAAGLSPRGIEFKRAHLYDVNPVGVVA
jgi:hypothetical protein